VAAASKASLPGRNKLAGALGLEMIQVLQRFEREGFSPFREDWLRLDMLKGCPVRVLQWSAEIRGVAHGIDGDGALWVEVAGVRQRFISGEVSLRPA
jgi:BirA family biotin operon repressor/biotin-[acetyl-CoA-carboxylase] ligase